LEWLDVLEEGGSDFDVVGSIAARVAIT
jgi:hypothetical protein